MDHDVGIPRTELSSHGMLLITLNMVVCYVLRSITDTLILRCKAVNIFSMTLISIMQLYCDNQFTYILHTDNSDIAISCLS